MHYHYATGMLYQLSYMAVEALVAKKSNTETLLQHVAERFLSRMKIEDEEKRASPQSLSSVRARADGFVDIVKQLGNFFGINKGVTFYLAPPHCGYHRYSMTKV